ncbi:putative GCN5-related N-acetyltransferase [metagenome]|uniref:Putative GCN5-related N-acetyltransferase n=1 Tax=metagenome TaxID=256318 RepID=A0A2P2CEC3_9ZZZZ
MVDVPTLTDGVVTLRRHRDDDVPGVVEQSNDPLSQRWTTVPVPYGSEDAKRFVRDIMPGGWATDLEWGFAVEVEGRYAGTISLRNKQDGRAEIGYGSHPWVRGAGHMESALRLLVDWGFATKQLTTIIWWANRGNWASRKTAWRLGFTVEGTVRQWLSHRGVLTDAWAGTLLRDDPRQPRGHWYVAPVLSGGGVRLRPLQDTDVPRIVEACADPVTATWLGRMPSPYGTTEAIAWLEDCTENAATGRAVTWAVTEPAGDQLLGVVNLFDFIGGREAEVGYWTHPDARGRAVATAATRLALHHALGDLGLRQVRAMAAVDNVASRRVLERVGMRQWGVEREGIQVRSGWVDAACYDVRADEVS